MPSHCNSYGFSGGFAAICAAISWYLVQERACKINVANLFSETFNSENLQMFHYIAMIVGAVIFVLSFFDFAGILYDIKLLFVAAVLGIFASGVFDTSSFGGAKNVIQAQDEVGISIMVLDLIAALLLISAAISFSRTY